MYNNRYLPSLLLLYVCFFAGLCVNSEGHLIVVDNKLSQIFIFQINGKIIRKFGTYGTASDQLVGPHYAAVNNVDDIFVTDFYSHEVKVSKDEQGVCGKGDASFFTFVIC